MSLFPAYLADEPRPSTSNVEDGDWLENRSFPVQLQSSSTPQSPSSRQKKSRRRSRSTSDGSPERKKVKSKKRSRSRERRRSRSRTQSRERARKRSRSRTQSRERARKRSRSRTQSRERTRKRSRSRSRERSRRSSHSLSRKKSSKKKHEKERIPTKEELVAKYSNKKTFLEDVGLKPEDAFREDERRSAHYLTVKSLPISETALYNPRWKRELLSESGKNRYLKDNAKTSKNYVRFFHKEFQRAFLKSDKRGELIDLSQALKRPAITSKDFNAIFLKLNLTESDLSEKPKISSDSTITDKDDLDDFKLHEIQMKTKEFNEKLRRNPRDEKAWIEFVDFQDQVLRDCSFEGEDEKNVVKAKSKSVLRQRAVAEKKLSVLKTALQDNPNSIPLLTKRLKISAEILDSATLEKEWQELLFRYPASIPLWKSYIRFLSSQFSTFSVAKTIDVLSSCVDRFSKIPGSNENHILFVIQWAANIWSSAGYRERGVGLYQALMELNFDAPSQIPENYSLEDRLALFEQFWDSSAPRFGDQGAVGWQNVLRNKTASMVEGLSSAAQVNHEDQLLAEAGGRVEEAKLWLALELYRETHHWQPYRSSEEESDDPDRMVSFDDLKPFLFVFQEPSSRFKLALSFLTFLGCNFTRNSMSSLGERVDFDFCNLHTETMQQWLGFLSPDAISVELEGSLLQRVTPDLVSDLSLQTFVRNVFAQGLTSMEDPLRTQFCVLWLQFEQEMSLHANVGSAKKRQLKEIKSSIKKFLEADRNNILIYCAYAQALHRLESYQSSSKILQTILSAEKSSHLYRFAVGLELEAHLALTSIDLGGSSHLDESIWLLSLMATGQPYRKKDVDNVEVLSLAHQAKSLLTKKLFQETKEKFRYDGPAIRRQSPMVLQSQLFDDIFCLVWLTSLIDSESDDEIDKVVARVCVELKEENTFESKLLIEHLSTKLRLDVLRFHWNNRSPTKARSILKHLLEPFPSNPSVLDTLVSKSDLRPTVSNPFWRDSLKVLSGKNVSSAHGLILMTKTLVSKFMESNQEDEEEGINNPVAVGYLNKALYILNDATQKDEMKQVVVIWRLLMWVTKTLAEISPKKFNQDSIKSIFYRAIQDCPCAKVLYLDLMNYTNHSEGQVQSEIEEILNEKEVRVRLPAEELKVLLEPEEEHQVSN